MIRAIWSKHGDAQVHDLLRLLNHDRRQHAINPAIRPPLRSVVYCLPRNISRIHTPERNLYCSGDLAFLWLVTGTSATTNDVREDCTRHNELLLVGRPACIRHERWHTASPKLCSYTSLPSIYLPLFQTTPRLAGRALIFHHGP
jgi:hypothetical protein